MNSIPTAPTKAFYSEWHTDLTTIGPNSSCTVRCVLNDSQQHLATHFLKHVRRFPALSVRLSAAVASAPQCCTVSSFGTRVGEDRTLSCAPGPSQRKKNYAGLLE